MYKVFLGELLLPVPPQKITTKVNGNNKTMTLINGVEINQIKPAGLTDFSFSCILPGVWYPFAQYSDGFLTPNYYLDQIEQYKLEQKSFQFIITRIDADGTRNYETNMTVTLEDYQIVEDANNGSDLEVAINLKQYIPYSTVVVDIPLTTDKESTVANVSLHRAETKPIPNTYTVKKGDTLWAIAKKLLGDGAKCWNLAKLNGISNPNLIYPGQVLKIQEVAAVKPSVSTATRNGNQTNKQSIRTPSPISIGTVPGGSRMNKTIQEQVAALGVMGTLTGARGYCAEGYQGRSSFGGGTSAKGNTHSGGRRKF